ncbi:hypothetical protein FA15DRAFT_711452 [Coprinopsis marcescibilis]|uniref:Uncharacterized protein n=1 Tax=Coprinopsis marcescibilis TaxID=230819 RepID=A0A5C3KAK0_COPMA|nr:hypothetical protein FA15DRAFT_711452 [Coprinopsis marcescibilis]
MEEEEANAELQKAALESYNEARRQWLANQPRLPPTVIPNLTTVPRMDPPRAYSSIPKRSYHPRHPVDAETGPQPSGYFQCGISAAPSLQLGRVPNVPASQHITPGSILGQMRERKMTDPQNGYLHKYQSRPDPLRPCGGRPFPDPAMQQGIPMNNDWGNTGYMQPPPMHGLAQYPLHPVPLYPLQDPYISHPPCGYYVYAPQPRKPLVFPSPPEAYNGKYNLEIGDACATVSTYLLRDGIHSHYLNKHEETDDEDRFEVQIWNRESMTYCVNDYDQGTYTLIDGAHLQNAKFNLVQWYQRTMEGSQISHADTFPLPDWVSDTNEVLDIDSDGDDEPIPVEVDGEMVSNTDDLCEPFSKHSDSTKGQVEDIPSGKLDELPPDGNDDLPDLQSVSGHSSETDGKSVDYHTSGWGAHFQPFGFSSDKEHTTPVRNPPAWKAHVEFQFTEPVISVLGRGSAYPGDPKTWQEVTPVTVEHLRNPHFNVGLWYAEACAVANQIQDLEGTLMKWMLGRELDLTALGRCFELSIAGLLSEGAPYKDDELSIWEHGSVPRFNVHHDPKNDEILLVMDHHKNCIKLLRSVDAERPGFDLFNWYEGAQEEHILRQILLEDMEYHGAPSLLGKPIRIEQPTFERVATSLLMWQRNKHRVDKWY